MKPTDRDLSQQSDVRDAPNQENMKLETVSQGTLQRFLFHLAWIGALAVMAGFVLVLLFMY